MPFLEAEDLADMLSDAGVPVTWTPAVGEPVTRTGLFFRHTEPALTPEAGAGVPIREKNPSVLVEGAYFAGVAIGDELQVDGETWVVREPALPMRSLLQLYLAAAPAAS